MATAGSVVLRRECAPHQRRDLEHVEKTRGHPNALYLERLSFLKEKQSSEAIGRHVVEHTVLLAPVDVVGG